MIKYRNISLHRYMKCLRHNFSVSHLEFKTRSFNISLAKDQGDSLYKFALQRSQSAEYLLASSEPH